MKFIPKKIKILYKNLPLKDKLQVYLRWPLCPFERIEEHIPKKGTIIDIGCGRGMLCNLASTNSEERNVIGLDFSNQRIIDAKKTILNRKNIQFINADILDKQLPDADCIIMSDVLHHIAISEKPNVLKKIYTKLNSTGVFLLQDVARKPLLKFWFTYGADYFLQKGQGLTYQKHEELEKLLINAGFKVEILQIHKGYPVADVLFVCKK
jgi:2-polyprenyl-3-methyl-5-hydroxy-6-metoxy-1,4-benzoquinol methylase